jgi:hypothetical protein
MNGVAEEVFGSGQRGKRFLDGLSKEQLELRADCTKFVGWSEGKVQLKTTREKEDTVDGLTYKEVKELDGGECSS